MTLEARSLSFAYPCGRELYRELSLAVEPGERVALQAPSGSGKTTLCRLLAGYLAPGAGEVLVDGAPLPLVGTRGAAALPVQLLWQHPEQAFDPRMRMGKSLGEVLAARPRGPVRKTTPAGSSKDAPAGVGVASSVEALHEAFGIRREWMARLPHELSGGELMRCAMVRALSVHPRYLIADEATAMLDALTQAELWRVLLELQRQDGWGLVLVSHSPALVARVATRTVDLAGRRGRAPDGREPPDREQVAGLR